MMRYGLRGPFSHETKVSFNLTSLPGRLKWRTNNQCSNQLLLQLLPFSQRTKHQQQRNLTFAAPFTKNFLCNDKPEELRQLRSLRLHSHSQPQQSNSTSRLKSRKRRSNLRMTSNSHRHLINNMAMQPTMAMSSRNLRTLHLHPILRFETGVAAHPHPKRVASGGEDAFFVFHRSPYFYSLGVADGVAEWRNKKGVNPALYPRQLIEGAQLFNRDRIRLEEEEGGEEREDQLELEVQSFPKPMEILIAAYQHAQNAQIIGSSTLCIMSLNGFIDQNHEGSSSPSTSTSTSTPTGTLTACNLGDSQFLVIREGRVMFKSDRQFHFFGCPYQFGYAPEIEFSTLEDVQQIELAVLEGDVVIMGTDGLFDNVTEDRLIQFSQSLNEPNSLITPQMLAQRLADYALNCSQSKYEDTPYSKEVSAETGQIYRGGKMDDITVIVSKIIGV